MKWTDADAPQLNGSFSEDGFLFTCECRTEVRALSRPFRLWFPPIPCDGCGKPPYTLERTELPPKKERP